MVENQNFIELCFYGYLKAGPISVCLIADFVALFLHFLINTYSG